MFVKFTLTNRILKGLQFRRGLSWLGELHCGGMSMSNKYVPSEGGSPEISCAYWVIDKRVFQDGEIDHNLYEIWFVFYNLRKPLNSSPSWPKHDLALNRLYSSTVKLKWEKPSEAQDQYRLEFLNWRITVGIPLEVHLKSRVGLPYYKVIWAHTREESVKITWLNN